MNSAENNEMVEYRLNRAKATLSEIAVLIDNKFWTTAINRIYYASYYGVSALLLKIDIKPQSHSGTRQMFGLHFVKENKISSQSGKFYSQIFDMRHTGDYDDFVDFTKEEVLLAYENAIHLIIEIEQLLDQ